MAQAETREAAAPAVATAAITVATKDIPHTSIATRGTNPGEVMVQFQKWHAYGQTAYQRGQFAGFPLAVADKMERAGVVVIDPGYRREPATNRMVRK